MSSLNSSEISFRHRQVQSVNIVHVCLMLRTYSNLHFVPRVSNLLTIGVGRDGRESQTDLNWRIQVFKYLLQTKRLFQIWPVWQGALTTTFHARGSWATGWLVSSTVHLHLRTNLKQEFNIYISLRIYFCGPEDLEPATQLVRSTPQQKAMLGPLWHTPSLLLLSNGRAMWIHFIWCIVMILVEDYRIVGLI